jgi:hypothetical protein
MRTFLFATLSLKVSGEGEAKEDTLDLEEAPAMEEGQDLEAFREAADDTLLVLPDLDLATASARRPTSVRNLRVSNVAGRTLTSGRRRDRSPTVATYDGDDDDGDGGDQVWQEPVVMAVSFVHAGSGNAEFA